MNRKGTLLIISGIALLAVIAGMLKLQGTTRQHPFDAPAGTAHTARDRHPFRSAVVELTFRSKSLHEGEEYLSATGRRIEYIDVTSGRRREDYERTATTMRQLTSTEGHTVIFDGTKLYLVAIKNGNRVDRIVDLREGSDYTVWRDASIEELPLPGTRIGEERFLGRPCKVYTLSHGADVQKWWVWDGVTLRSESHVETNLTVLDTWEEAVRVEKDVKIDLGLFSPPPDVTFEPVPLPIAPQQNDHKLTPWMRMGPELGFLF